MIASRADRRAGAVAATALLGLVLHTAPAAAQAGPPIRLTPPSTQPAAPPPETQPAEPSATKDAPPDQAPSSVIEVGRPPPVSTESVGLLDPAKAGLPATVWQGASRGVVERLIALLPNATVSRPARELTRRLMLVAAPAPEASPGATKDKTISFASMRAVKLLAMGDTDSAVGLARLVPGRLEDETLARVMLEAAFANFDNSGACSLARGEIGRFTGEYWQKALIFCQALANEHSRAQLGLSMLHEQQPNAEDAAFSRLIGILGGDTKTKVDKLPQPTPLHIAAMRAAKQNLPADLAASSEPLVLRMVANSPNATPDMRLVAAERAEAFGVLPAETLAEAYDGATITPEQINNALAFADKETGPRGRAAIYRAVKTQAAGAGRAETLQRAWRLARERGGYATSVRVNLPALLELQPDESLMFFAVDAARALLLAGKRDEARGWYDLVRTHAASGNELAANAEALLWPVFWFTDAEARKTAPAEVAKRIDAWRAAQTRVDAAGVERRSALLSTLLVSTGAQPQPALVEPLLSGKAERENAAMPNMGLWIGLGAALEAGHVGEAALFALASLGADGAAGAAPHTVALVLDALRAAGLDDDARALALETAIAAGL